MSMNQLAGAVAAAPLVTGPANHITLPVAMAKHHVALFAIMALAVGLRFALIVVGPGADIQRAYEPDSGRYVELATNLRSVHTFGRAAEVSGVVHVPLAALRAERGELEALDSHGLRAEVFRTPGYPFFLSIFQYVGLGLHGALFVQALLGAISVLAVYALGRCLFISIWPALLAAAIVAVHPASIVASASILSETLFTSLMLVGLWCVLRRRQSAWWVTLGGLLLGLAVLVRPIGILLGVAVVLWMLATDRRVRTLWPALCLTIASLLPAAGWMARNAQVGLGWQISSVPPINTLFYTVAYMQIAERGGDYAGDWPSTVDKLFGSLRTQIEPNETTFAAMNRLSHETIRAKPKLYGKVIARSAVKFMTDHSAGVLMTRLGREYEPTGLRSRLLAGNFSLDGVSDRLGLAVAGTWTLWNLLLAGAMALGTILLVWRRHWSALLLLGGLCAYFLLATQATGLERFRVPMLGFQALLVAALFVPRRTVRQITSTA